MKHKRFRGVASGAPGTPSARAHSPRFINTLYMARWAVNRQNESRSFPRKVRRKLCAVGLSMIRAFLRDRADLGRNCLIIHAFLICEKIPNTAMVTY